MCNYNRLICKWRKVSVSFYLYVLILLTMILNWETGFTFLRKVHRSPNSQRSPYQCSLLCPHCPRRGTPPCVILFPCSPFQHALVNRFHTSKAFVLLMSGSADVDALWRKHGPLAVPWNRTWHRWEPQRVSMERMTFSLPQKMGKRLLKCFLFGSLLQVAGPQWLGCAPKSRVEKQRSAPLPAWGREHGSAEHRQDAPTCLYLGVASTSSWCVCS